MDDNQWLGARFEANRTHAGAVASRMLGSAYALAQVAAGGAARHAAPGLVRAPGGRPRVAFALTLAHGRIFAIELVANPDRLRQLDVSSLED